MSDTTIAEEIIKSRPMLPEAWQIAAALDLLRLTFDPAEPQIRTIPAQEPDAWAQMKCDFCKGEGQCIHSWLSLRVAWLLCHGNWFRPKPFSEVVKRLK